MDLKFGSLIWTWSGGIKICVERIIDDTYKSSIYVTRLYDDYDLNVQ